MKLPVFKRDIIKTINKRLRRKGRFIQVIIGPRQVVKTTAIQQVLQELDLAYHYEDTDLSPHPIEWIAQ